MRNRVSVRRARAIRRARDVSDGDWRIQHWQSQYHSVGHSILNGCFFLFCCVVIGAGCRPSGGVTDRRPETSAPRDLLTNQEGQLVQESWASHSIHGSKVGHRRTRIYRLEDRSPPLLRIEAVDYLELRRFGDVSEQELTTASLETEDGKVLQLAYQVKNGDSIKRAEGTVTQGVLLLTRMGVDADDVARFAWADKQQGIFAVERSLRRAPLQVGQERTIEAFLPLADRLVKIEFAARREESVDVDGENQTLTRIEAVDPRSDSWKIPTVYWTDRDGNIVKVHEAFLDRVTVTVAEARATRANNLVRVDLGVDVGVRVDKAIPNPTETKYAVYRVEIEGLQPQDVFPVGLSQRVLPAEPNVALVTVSQVLPDEPTTPDVEIEPPSQDDLAPNALIQSDHPRIVAIANLVAGSLDDPWFAAQLLEQHVHDRLEETDFTHVFSSAVEVAERRRGDCSEHAVLLAAICRARNIPARVTIGLFYSAQNQSFLYHMWNEVWIKDRWVPLDATLAQGGIGACHLKLRDSNLARETAYGMVSSVIHLIGRTKIDVVATQLFRP